LAAAPELSLSRPAGRELRVRLAGTWTLGHDLPDGTGLENAVGTDRPDRVSFDTSGLAAWDSALPTFLLDLLDRLEARGVTVDRDGLPAGVRRLLAMARAATPHEPREKGRPASVLVRLGRATRRLGGDILDHVEFVGELARSIGRRFRGRAWYRAEDMRMLLADCGGGTLPIASLVAVLIGAILAFVGAVQLREFGAQLFVADLVAIATTREMAALMTAIIVAGRTGAAFASHLGTMTVNEEIDALETMAIPPMDYLVLPRVVALAAMTPLVTIYAMLVGIAGGGLVGVGLLDLGVVQYAVQTTNALSLVDIASGLVKALVFGVVVAVAGCLRGMQCGRSAADVGRAANSAVVTGIVGILVADAILTFVYNVLGI
jgi:phospholipid/cholesterol/gamma-HCH transport system permease protein